jgi:uncharacterized protein
MDEEKTLMVNARPLVEDLQTENAMSNRLDLRRISIFLAIAFGVAWLVGLVIYLNGGLTSPIAVPLLAVGYMMSPALAHVLTRVITREGWANTGIRPHFRRGWPFWAAAWVVPAVLVIIGAGMYYAFFPQHFDANLSQLQTMLPPDTIAPWTFIIIQVVQAILISPLVNGLFTFGEEFGWRGYLLPKLMPLGGRTAMLVSGVIWGVWHWPVIAMGHNYGLDYPGYPWTGMLMMVVFTFATGTFLSWVTLRGGSVWPAVIGHAAINGIANLPVLFTQGEPNTLLGPLAVGLIGGIGFLVVALVLLFVPGALSTGRTPMFSHPQVSTREEMSAA